MYRENNNKHEFYISKFTAPLGGYKLSGFSYVMNFLEKATKPIIIESSGGEL